MALESYPGDPMANYNLANALVRLGRHDEAIDAFQRAIASKPRVSYLRHNYAILLARGGRLEEAERQLRMAVQLDPAATESIRAMERVQAMRAGGQP